MKHGYVKVAAAVPTVKVGDCYHNVARIAELARQAAGQSVEIISFPELSITGYSCADLFLNTYLQEHAQHALQRLLCDTAALPLLIIVGMPLHIEDRLYNVAVTLQKGEILSITPKTYVPNYREFQEQRWFASGADLTSKTTLLCGFEVPVGSDIILRSANGLGIGIEICEDMWVGTTPGDRLALEGAHIIFNLSASNEIAGKQHELRTMISALTLQQITAYIYASCGQGESSTDMVYSGKGFIAELGEMISEMPRFTREERLMINDIDVDAIRNARLNNSSYRSAAALNVKGNIREVAFKVNTTPKHFVLDRKIEPYPFIPASQDLDALCQEMWDIQATGLCQRLDFLKCKHIVIGLSGGLDSTLALLVAIRAFDMLGLDRTGIIGVTMPGLGTSHRTHNNALAQMQLLGITMREIPIGDAALDHLRTIGHDTTTTDVTYENAQARERTQVLMDIANMEKGLVIGTGDLSELALGWATYNGDHMSMYSVNASVPKTAIRAIVRYIADRHIYGEELSHILLDIIDTPISPELTALGSDNEIIQDTESINGPYDIHDFFIYHFMHFGASPEKLYIMACRAFEGTYTKTIIKNCLKIFIRKFFAQQFKRNCMPDSPKVTPISFSPRSDWRMPSDFTSSSWLDVIDTLEE